MSLDSLLEECSASGWLLNNLFVLDDGEWRANLRSADGRFTEFGKGESASEALERTMSKIADAEFSNRFAQEDNIIRNYVQPNIPHDWDGTDLLTSLGLIQREPVRRI